MGAARSHERRTTSSDVAKAAGVSRSTVSFVLNDTPGQSIPEATRAAVRRAAVDLGYVPSVTGRALRTGRTRLVLCVATDWEPSAIMDETLSLLSRELRDAGYAVAVAKLPGDAAHDDVLWQAISAEVVVAMFDLPDRVRERLRAMRVPVVEMYLHSRGQAVPTADLQTSVGRAQVEVLVSAACTHLVQVVPDLPDDREVVRDRCTGAREAALARGLAAPRIVRVTARGDIEPAAVEQIFGESTDRGLGICAYNDVVALRVIAAGRRLGRLPPDDYRVIGVDDDPASAFVDPGVSSVRLELARLNAVVVDAVRRALGLPTAETPRGPFLSVVRRRSA